MIDHAAARVGLAAILDGQIEGAGVQAAGIDAVATFPAVIIGQPSWSPVDRLPYGIERSTWPVACVVAREAADTATIGALDQLWPRVVALLKTASETDQTLGGICAEALITRADFGQFGIQGTNYPAQLVFVELYG